MGVNVYPPVFPKQNVVTLTSGSSWTVPTGVTKVTATLIGAGGGSGRSAGSAEFNNAGSGQPGEIRITSITTTPGASISYAIGAGGTGGTSGVAAGQGGTTTFTGATSAVGGLGGPTNDAVGIAGTPGLASNNGAMFSVNGGTSRNGAAGGDGMITLEYWV